MQAAAVRRVDADRLARTDEACISAALGAVAVQHIRVRIMCALRHMAPCGHVAPADMAAHRDAAQAQREVRGERRERRIGAFAAGRGIGHDTDRVPARGLRARQVEDVPEQPADRRPQDVQDLEGADRHEPRVESFHRPSS